MGRIVAAETGGAAAPAPEDPLSPTIFHEDWWLNAATGGAYEAVEVRSSGRAVARLPYVRSRIHGRPSLGMPSLTHVLGPAVLAQGSPANAAIRRDAILHELIAQLPKSSHFFQRFHGDITDTIAFMDHAFETSVQFSFEIEPTANANVWRSMRDKTRNVIRRSQERGECDMALESEAFVRFYFESVASKGSANYYSPDSMLAALKAAEDRGRASFIGKRDSNGDLSAAACILTDRRRSYYFLSARRASASNGCVSHIVWTAIQDAMEAGRVFDFEGANTRGAALFYAAFGATPSPRYLVSKSTRGFKLARLGENLIERVKGRLR